jgi:acetyl esterase/lipase
MRRLFGPDIDRLQLVPGGRHDWLVGGTPSELPDRYAQLPPLHRVHPGCPPTLLVHGDHDQMRRSPPCGSCTGAWSRRVCR